MKPSKPHDHEAHILYDLHYRKYIRSHGRTAVICGLCRESWPCVGAKEQIEEAKRGANPVWFMGKPSRG